MTIYLSFTARVSGFGFKPLLARFQQCQGGGTRNELHFIVFIWEIEREFLKLKQTTDLICLLLSWLYVLHSTWRLPHAAFTCWLQPCMIYLKAHAIKTNNQNTTAKCGYRSCAPCCCGDRRSLTQPSQSTTSGFPRGDVSIMRWNDGTKLMVSPTWT